MSSVKSSFLAAVFMFVGVSAMAAGSTPAPTPKPVIPKYLPYRGSAALADVRTGKVTTSLRLGDRTQGAHAFKVGEEVALVNTDTKEESRALADQITANAYGHVKFTAITVVQFSSLSPADQKELLQFYTQAKIDQAKGIISHLTFTFMP